MELNQGLETVVKNVKEKIYGHSCNPDIPRDKKKENYYCGELPIGKIVDQNKKELIKIKVPRKKLSAKGAKITISPFNIPVFMSRSQRGGKLNIQSLDSNQLESKSISEKFGEDFFVEYKPKDQNLYITPCFVSPGSRIYTPDRVIKVHAEKKIFWFIKAKVDIKSKVNMVSYSFDNISGCGVIKAGYDALSLRDIYEKPIEPQVQMIKVFNSKVSNGNLRGLQVKRVSVKGNLVYKIISFVGRIFGYNVNKMIKDGVKKELHSQYKKMMGSQNINGITVKHIENGTWVAKLIDKHSEKYIAQFNSAMVKEVKKFEIDKIHALAKKELDEYREIYCRTAFGNLPVSTCNVVIDELLDNVLIFPFKEDVAMTEAGCYSAFSSNHYYQEEQSLKWWANGCGLKSTLEIRR